MSGIVLGMQSMLVNQKKKLKIKNPCLHGAYFKIRVILIVENN